MTRIPETMIDEIRTSTDIVTLIGEHVQLTKRGKNWFGLCPFHNENSPSFSVSEDKQLFHCFGCGASGNAITFLMDIENRPFLDAVTQLAHRTGIVLENEEQIEVGKTSTTPNRQLYEAYALTADFYNHLLLNTTAGESALHYLLERGFTREELASYNIGYSLEERDELVQLLQRQEFPLLEMETGGLIMMSEDGSHFYDRFRGRIMFPLEDENGKVVAFSARRFMAHQSNQPKYLNSPETPIFEKSTILYNLHRARMNIRKTGTVLLFEGFMDVIAANRSTITNAVALMGTALSKEQVIQLKRMAKELIICTDGDDAGWEAAKRFALLATKYQFPVKIALLPANMDPDDYLEKNGSDSFLEQIIQPAHSFLAFLLLDAKKGKNLTFETDVLQYIKEALIVLNQWASPIERDLYLQQLAEETKVTLEALREQYRQVVGNTPRSMSKQPISKQIQQPAQSTKKRTGVERAYQQILAHALQDAHVLTQIEEQLGDQLVTDYQLVFQQLATFYERNGEMDYQRFVEQVDRSVRNLVLESTLLDVDEQAKKIQVDECLHYLKNHQISVLIEDIRQMAQEAERMNDHTRALELAREIIQLRNSMQ